MSKVITVTLSEQGIKEAIKELQEYRKWVEDKTNALMEKLAIIGAQEAAVRFAAAPYDGVNDSHVSAVPTANGWKIVASGEAVAFIEFGAGVYHNPQEPYPRRPAGVSGIGEYGRGLGKRQGWTYEGAPGTSGSVLPNGRVFTRGNPASMPMWYASQEITNRVTQIAREVFGGG